MDEQGKLIMNPNMAVFLLRKGFTIIDLKANRNNPTRSIFVFRNEEGLNEAMTEYTHMSVAEKKQLNKED